MFEQKILAEVRLVFYRGSQPTQNLRMVAEDEECSTRQKRLAEINNWQGRKKSSRSREASLGQHYIPS